MNRAEAENLISQAAAIIRDATPATLPGILARAEVRAGTSPGQLQDWLADNTIPIIPRRNTAQRILQAARCPDCQELAASCACRQDGA